MSHSTDMVVNIKNKLQEPVCDCLNHHNDSYTRGYCRGLKLRPLIQKQEVIWIPSQLHVSEIGCRSFCIAKYSTENILVTAAYPHTWAAISSLRNRRMDIRSSPTAARSTSRPGSLDLTKIQYRWSRTDGQMDVTLSLFCSTTLTNNSRKKTPASSSYCPPSDPGSSAPWQAAINACRKIE